MEASISKADECAPSEAPSLRRVTERLEAARRVEIEKKGAECEGGDKFNECVTGRRTLHSVEGKDIETRECRSFGKFVRTHTGEKVRD